MALIVWIHNLVYRLVFGLIRLAVSLVWRWALVVIALLGEEVRRYAGLTLSGIIIVLFGKATLNYAPESVQRPLVVFSLVVLMIWAMAVRRAFRFTMRNNMERVRARTRQKKLAGEVSAVYERVPELLAKKTRGTPLERVFPTNRSALAEEQAAAQRAAEQAAERAERDRVSREDSDRERDRLAALEPDPFN